jgi:hypothetical protein
MANRLARFDAAGRGLLPSVSCPTLPTSPPPAASQRRHARRLPGRPSVRRPHRRGRMLLPASDEERPLPDARRPQHRPSHARRPRPLRCRPPYPRPILGRDHRHASRGQPPHPPPARSHRPGHRPPHRWAWAPSHKFLEQRQGTGPEVAVARNAGCAISVRRVLASRRCAFGRARHVHRSAWGPSVTFDARAGCRPPGPQTGVAPRVRPALSHGFHRPGSRPHGRSARPRWA